MRRATSQRRAGPRIANHELGVVLAVPVVALGSYGFAQVLDEVLEGESRPVDRAILLALRSDGDPSDPLGPRWLEEAARDVTALGSVVALSLVTIAVLGYLLLDRKPRAAGFVAGSVAGAQLLSFGMKALIDRPRPALVPHLTHVITASFPSGHAMLSAAVYLTLGALLARLHASVALKVYVLGWALFLSGLVGVSRVYVGVHWPTDVLAGWAAGSVWAALCWLGARWLQRRGEVEPPEAEAD